jgi:DNA polymerase-3 subunit delta
VKPLPVRPAGAPDPQGGVFLLYGREEFLKREFIEKLRRDLFPSALPSEMGFEQFELPAHSLDAVINFFQNASFFASRQMAVVRGIDVLEAEDRQRLQDFVGHFPASSTLVLVSEETNLKKDPFIKALSEKAQAIACHTPFDKDLPRWVEGRAKKRGKTIDGQATALLIERTGKDTALLDSVVEQLAVYTGPEPRISAGHAEALLGRSVQADAFRLIDLLVEKKIRLALENLEALLREGAKIYEIIGALATQTDRLYRVRTMMDEGFPSESIQTELRLHPFFAGRVFEQAGKVSAPRLRQILKELVDCDEAVKTGRLGERLALQQLFLKIVT